MKGMVIGLKKLLAFMLILTLAVSNFAFVTFATSDAQLVLTFNPQEGTINLTGEAYGLTSFILLESNASLDDISSTNLPKDYRQVYLSGNFNLTFKLPDGLNGGKHTLHLVNNEVTDSDTFLYFNVSNANSLLATLTSKTQKEEFVSFASQNAANFGIDVSLQDYDSSIFGVMFDMYSSYNDCFDFYDKFYVAMALKSFKGKDRQGVENSLRSYQSYLGIDYITDYDTNAAFTDVVKNKITSYLSNADISTDLSESYTITNDESFKALLTTYHAMALCTSTDSYQSVNDIYTKKFDFLKSIVNANPNYKKVSSSDVYKNIVTQIKANPMDNPLDLKTYFNKAVTNAKGNGGGGQGNNDKYDDPSPSTPTQSTVPSAPDTQFETIPKEGDLATMSMSLPTLSQINVSFNDVEQSHWASEAILTLASSGIISGDGNGTFRPNDSITRAEFAKLVVGAFSVVAQKKTFSDISADAWYEKYVSMASGAGLINGYEDGTYKPNEPIKKQDAILILYRLTKLMKVDYSGYSPSGDMSDVSLYALTAIGAFINSGIIKGDALGNVGPLNNITRAESAKIIYSLIVDMKQKI